MYTPAHFAVDDETAAAFLASIEVADLVTTTDDGLVATFLPLIFDPERGERGTLLGKTISGSGRRSERAW
jgi:transcriptional regulator